MLDALHAGEELLDFLGTEDNGQRLRLLGKWEDVLEGPILFEGHPVQEANIAATAVCIEPGASFFSLVR